MIHLVSSFFLRYFCGKVYQYWSSPIIHFNPWFVKREINPQLTPLHLSLLPLQIWFKNRRAKWRKRERTQLQEIKTGLGPQFNGLVPPIEDTFYSSYPYNNWPKPPTYPLSSGKSIAWSLPGASQAMCFNSAQPNMSPGFTPSSPSATPVNGMTTQPLGGLNPTGGPPTCHYGSSAPPPTAYVYREPTADSLASLRLKAKHHSETMVGFSYPSRDTAPLSACQYGGQIPSFGGTTWRLYKLDMWTKYFQILLIFVFLLKSLVQHFAI